MTAERELATPTYALILCIVCLALHPSPASALDRGHQIILNRGLQIQAQVFPAENGGFNASRWVESNFTTVNTHHNSNGVSYLPGGTPWGRWLDNPSDELSSAESAREADMVSAQYYDEQPLTSANVAEAAAVFAYWRSHHPSVLLFTNQQGNEPTESMLRAYMSGAQPDMLMYDYYAYFGSQWHTAYSNRVDCYVTLEKYRRVAVSGNDGTGTTPIPFGAYLQVFLGPWWPHTPSESEIRLNSFLMWAAGAKFVSAFVYNQADASDIHTILFNGLGESSPTAAFYHQKETNRQSRNIGPALIRLVSTGLYLFSGQYAGRTSAQPANVPTYTSGSIPYLTSVTAVNLGTTNNGERGDITLGKFRVLDESFDGSGYSNQTYFMVLNGLCHQTASCAETRQTITLNFDFGASGITSLQRMSRETGLLENVPLTSLGGTTYKLDVTLDGGTGDLFKYNTGAPFVGQPPAPAMAVSFSPNGGTYPTAQAVTISCTVPDATIRYTTDGTDPSSTNGTEITSGGTVLVDRHFETLKAWAWKADAESPIKSADYVIQNGLDRPSLIPSGTATIDGDLAEWVGAEWAPLDRVYNGTPSDIAEGYYAVRWQMYRIYLAVKVLDTSHYFTDTYTGWNARDAVELYIHTTGTSSVPYPNFTSAQQYAVGVRNSARTEVWKSFGNGAAVPTSAGFSAAGREVGQWLHYEAAFTPFRYYGEAGGGGANVLSPLTADQIIGLDAAAVGHSTSAYTGMKAENAVTDKWAYYDNFGRHRLAITTAIGGAKTTADGAAVGFSGIVSADFGNYFYVEDSDRVYGIRVDKPGHGLAVGQSVSIAGITDTLSSGERHVAAAAAVAIGQGEIRPLGLVNRVVGGGSFGTLPNGQVGVANGTGLNNIGLLVKTTGQVGTKGAGWFMISDGSGPSVKVIGSVPAGAVHVAVTGVSSLETPGGVRVIKARDASDVQQVAP